MAVDFIFKGTEESGTDEHRLRAFHNIQNKIFIEIDMDNSYSSFIVLDKETAIKFSKELRKQISYFIESEVINE